jgi:CTP synthase (UTP-ammonia lyase)
MGVFENRELKRMFGPNRDEIIRGWRKLHDEEFHNLNSSPNIIKMIKSRRIKWLGHVARMGEKRIAYRDLLVKLEGKRVLERHRRRWENNIEVDNRELGCGGMEWILLAQDKHMWRAIPNTVM